MTYLNAGCGRIILPGAKPAHHQLIPDEVYGIQEWCNVDRIPNPGVNKVIDLFRYPWDLEDDQFDGAILSHVAEHIPHEINTGVANKGSLHYERYHALQDGFFAFFHELWRVMKAGAVLHLISPYAMCSDSFIDPTHTRYLMPQTFHYLVPDANAPFEYAIGSQRWKINAQTYGFSPYLNDALSADQLMRKLPTQEMQAAYANLMLEAHMQTKWNMASEFYVALEVVK